MGEEEYVTQERVAELFGVSIKTVERWRYKGLIRSYRLGHRTVRFRLSEVVHDRIHGVPKTQKGGAE